METNYTSSVTVWMVRSTGDFFFLSFEHLTQSCLLTLTALLQSKEGRWINWEETKGSTAGYLEWRLCPGIAGKGRRPFPFRASPQNRICKWCRLARLGLGWRDFGCVKLFWVVVIVCKTLPGTLSVPGLVLGIRNVQTSQTPSAMRVKGDGSLSQVPVSSGVVYYSAELSKQQLHGRRKIFSVLPCPVSAGPYPSCFLLVPGVTAPFSALLSPDSEKPYTERWYLWVFFIGQVP